MEKQDRVLLLISRIAGIVSALLILLIFVGELIGGGAGSLELSVWEWIQMIVFAAVWAGLLIGLKLQLLGAILTIGGMVLFYLLNFIFSGSFPRGPWFFVFILPGFIYLRLGIRQQKEKVSSGKNQ